MIDWNRTTTEDVIAINKIVKMAKKLDPELSVLDTQMDLEACHTHGCRLDLEKMQRAKPDDLMHDVLGIRRHLNHETGELMDCFLPRLAARD